MGRAPLAYLISEYPSVSHTFVRREIAALRRRGLAIDTFAVRAPAQESLCSPKDRQELASTWYLQPARPIKVIRDHVVALAKRPGSYLRTFARALRHRVPGMKSLLWSVFHFVEAIQLACELDRRGVQHLHTHFANSGGTIGMLASGHLGIPWSLTVHGSKAEFDYPAAPLLGAKVGAAAFVACVSHHGRSQLYRLSNIADWRKLFVSRCGVELDAFPRRSAEPPTGGRRRILCVGRLVAEKAQTGLVEALARLIAAGYDAELALVGDGAWRPLLEAQSRELGVADRCHLLGALPEEGVRDELEKAHLFASSSLIEGLPVALMEAMAIGIPVIAPRLSGIPELVREGDTGLLYDPGNWEDLAAALSRLLEDPKLGEHLANRGRSLIETDFDVDRAVAPLLERMKHGD